MAHVTVLGAGVIGLQSALSLLEAGHSVTIIAAHFPGDFSPEYASPWAGAHWRSHGSASDPRQQAWDTATYAHWLALLSSPSSPRCLRALDSYSYYPSAPREQVWYASAVQGFSPLPPSAFPYAGIQAATCFRGVALDAPAYLLWLLEQVRARGGRTVRQRVRMPLASGLAGLVPNGGVVVNALALGNDDQAMYPIKGQTVLVRGEAEAVRVLEPPPGTGGVGYVIPRPGSGTTILGGTKEAGNADRAVDEDVTRGILARCKALAPELLRRDGTFEVVSVQVGFRPGRKGGARMERERVAGRRVVHAYGHAGAGYQNSIGVAADVVRMVREWEREGPQEARL